MLRNRSGRGATVSCGFLVLLIFAVPACIGARNAPPAPSPSPVSEEPVRNDIERTLELEVSGNVTLDFSGTHRMQFYDFRSDRVDLKPVTVATVSTRFPIPYEPGRGIIIGISVVGNYEGDGTYTITERGEFVQPSPGQPVPSLSIVRAEIYDMEAEPAPTLIERIDTEEEPCEVVLRNFATEGSLECPKIVNDDGKVIAVRMVWAAPSS